MIAVAQALSHIEKSIMSNTIIETSITEAHGYVLAQDVVSDIDLPPFRQSAMDGYAVRLWGQEEFVVKGEIQAGSNMEVSLRQGEAVRIYTGARVPEEANKVVMKEHVEVFNSSIKVVKFQEKTNIKTQGEQIKRGARVLSKGDELNTAAISFLAGLGVAKLMVYKKPSVAVLISGNELLQPGDPWQQAKTYDSNSYILKLLLQKVGVDDISFYYVEDDTKSSVAMVGDLLDDHDFIVATGGISVGDYDLMRVAFQANDVEEQFYKINQKPGKPIYFGLKNDKVVFGLPGNPAACFINFQIYVLPALRRFLGKSISSFKKGVTDQKIVNNSGKALFLRGECLNGHLNVFSNQSSSLLQSLIQANALIYVPEDMEAVEIGDEVQYVDIVQ